MNKTDVIRAWKDPFYRASLSEEAQAALPQHPAGIADLTDDQIRTLSVSGGTTTAPNCTNYTYAGLNACSDGKLEPLLLDVKYRLPSMFGGREYVEAGGLMSYAPDYVDLTRRAATYIDKILKGAKPADLPVELASKYLLVINFTTAKALKLDLPWFLEQRADEMIE